MCAVVNVNSDNEKNFEGMGFKIAVPGRYILSLGRLPLEVGQSSKGSPMIKVMLKIEETADGSETEAKGATIFDNLVLTEKAEWKFTAFCLCSGQITEEEIKASGGAIDLDMFDESSRFIAEVGTESYHPKNDPSQPERIRNTIIAFEIPKS